VASIEHGRRIVQASWAGTAVFAVVCVLGLVSEAVRGPFIAACLALFAVGCVLFLWAYWTAVQRSRTDELGIGGLFFLAGPTAPRPIKAHLNGSLAVEVVLAVTTASIGIAGTSDTELNALAFAMLVPVYALGCTGLWGARHGTFGPRRQQPRRKPAATSAKAAGPTTRRPTAAPPDDGSPPAPNSTRPHQIGQNAPHG
jgi:hypothetical protein